MLAIGLSAAGAIAQEPAPTGLIYSLSGSVSLTSAADKTRISLSSHARLRALYEGDLLHGSQDGVVTIVLRSLKMLTICWFKCPEPAAPGVTYLLLAKDKSFRLPHGRTDEEIVAGAGVLKIGISAGSREVAPLLWSPAADSSIRAQDFHLRWNPPHAAEPFSVTISRADDTRLWSVEAVDSAQGGLSPQQESEVAGLLLRERSQSARQRYSVTISSDLQGAPKTSFSVVSSVEEAQVQVELARWDQAALDPLVRALSRAATWRAANLIYKVAEEYDRALILAPESVALLEADLAVHRQIGDLARSQELANRLRNLSSE
jgi:hypothetical protein